MSFIKHNKSTVELGGYFGLDLPDYGDSYADTIKFQSARAALRAILECSNIRKVFMPAYICSSMIKSANDAKVEVHTYALDESLYPRNIPIELPPDSVLLYVNYFGLCKKNISKLTNEISSKNLIIDNSQALFTSHEDTLATIYSPRKFVGLPDGGFIKTSPLLKITTPQIEDHQSIERMRYLLLRMSYSAREGYQDFQIARDSLQDTAPLGMSRLTRRLMNSIQWDQVRNSRRRNFSIIQSMLGHINEKCWVLGDEDAPLCYPLSLKQDRVSNIRKELNDHNIFTPIYWPDVAPRITANTIEDHLFSQTLYLPIDQRLEPPQIVMMANLVLALIMENK